MFSIKLFLPLYTGMLFLLPSALPPPHSPGPAWPMSVYA